MSQELPVLKWCKSCGEGATDFCRGRHAGPDSRYCPLHAELHAAPTTEPSKAEQADAPGELLTEEEHCALQYCEHILYEIEVGRVLRSDESHVKDYRAATITDAKRLAAAARKRINPVFARLMRATQPPASNAGELAAAAESLISAYVSRFRVPGRGMVGPIDEAVEALASALATKPQAGQKPVAWMTPNPYKPELLMVTIEKPNVNGVDWPGARPLVYGDVTSQAGDVAQDSGEPPLLGRWHHGEGYLVSGSIRIARWDCDTNPPDEFRDEVLDWVSNTLNAAIRAARTRGEGSGT